MSAETVTKKVDLQVGTPGAPQATEQMSALGRAMRDLNAAGRESGLAGRGGIVGLLRGAGVAAIFKIGADAIKAGIENWQKYKEGAIDAREAVEKTIATVPILGSIWGAEFAVLDQLSGAAGRYAAALKEVGERTKEIARQDKETKRFETIRDSAYEMQHPELKSPMGKLVGDKGNMDAAFKRLHDYQRIQAEVESQEEFLIMARQRAVELGPFAPWQLGEGGLDRLQAELAANKERASGISMSPAEIKALKQMASEIGKAMLDQLGEVPSKVADFFKKEKGFATAFKFISEQFWLAMDKGQLDAGRKFLKNARFDFMWPGGGGQGEGLGSKIEDAVQAAREKWWSMWHPNRGKSPSEGYLDQTVPGATEGRYLTGGGKPEVKVDAMDESIRVQRDTRDAIRDLARAIQANTSNVIPLN